MSSVQNNSIHFSKWFSWGTILVVMVLLVVSSRSYACKKNPPGPMYDLSEAKSGRTVLWVWSILGDLNFKVMDESGAEYPVSTKSFRLPTTMLQPLTSVTERAEVTLYRIHPEQALSPGTYTLLTGRKREMKDQVLYDRTKNRSFEVRDGRETLKPPEIYSHNVTVVRDWIYFSYDPSCEPIYKPRTRLHVRLSSDANFYKLIWTPDGRKKTITGYARGSTFQVPRRWFLQKEKGKTPKGTLKIIPTRGPGETGQPITRQIDFRQIQLNYVSTIRKELFWETILWVFPVCIILVGAILMYVKGRWLPVFSD